MTGRSNSSLASLLLTNRLVDSGAKPLTSRDYWNLLQAVEDPADLLGVGARDLAANWQLRPDVAERIGRLLDAGTALAVELEHLEQQGLQAVSPFDPAYPSRLRKRLGSTAPPLLYVAGPDALLGDPGVAVVGSRNVDDQGAAVARQAAELIARHGQTVISGGAKGVDQLAMDAARDAGGAVVGVLAAALNRRLRDPDIRRAIAAGRLCLITPYKPSAGFSVANAMARNKIIYALARVTLVVAADADRGGTWEGAVEALRRGFGAAAVWTGAGAGPGNTPLIERGAIPVDDLAQLFDANVQAPFAKEQLQLGI